VRNGGPVNSGDAWVTHMPWWSPENGAWWPGECDWQEIGYFPPEAAWEPADWNQLGCDGHAAYQTELARRRQRTD
jgi:hypothetical protein